MAPAELRAALVSLLPRLRRFAIALTGSRTDMDDLVQATCERALARAAQLREEDHLDRWVCVIMRAVWIDEMRSRRVRRHDPIEAAFDAVGDDGVAQTEGRLALASVRRALLELPQEYRTALMLVCVEGMSYKDAAEFLEVPIGTVMSRLARGRLALHTKLSASGGDLDARIGLEYSHGQS